MPLGLSLGVGEILKLAVDFTGVAITVANLYPVTELSENGDYVAQLGTSDDQAATFTLTGGNGAFAIGDVPAVFYTVDGQIATSNGDLLFDSSAGTIKGIVVADASLLQITGSSIALTISAAGYPDQIVNVPVGYGMLRVAANQGLRVGPGQALRVY